MKPHKHHIIPRYKCKKLGIEPDFDDNLVDVTREQHALIHWGYKCNDLSPLLEVCNPPQNIIDMIPLGDNRDSGAAVLLAEGEIDGIDNSGENNPNYRHGKAIGASKDKTIRKKNDKERNAVYHAKNRDKECKRMKDYYYRTKLKKQQGVGTLEKFL
jgi:hypothetical protein